MEFTEAQFHEVQKRLLHLFTTQQGIHTDEYNNFNAYIPEIILLVEEHIKSFYLDMHMCLHKLYVKDCFFVRPYEEKVGLDYPDRALIRSHYEVSLFGSLIYEVRKKPDKSIDEKSIDMDIKEEDVEEEDVEEDIPPEEDYGEEDAPEEAPIKPCKRRDQRDTYRKRILGQKWQDYSILVRQNIQPNHLIMQFPPLLGSALCHMSGVFLPPCAYSRAKYPTYLVSRNFKVFPYEETFALNFILLFNSKMGDKLEIRFAFHRLAQRYRTNSTVKITPKVTKVASSQRGKLKMSPPLRNGNKIRDLCSRFHMKNPPRFYPSRC